ncbi:MAG: FtsX-like permease family protein [Rickettsiales bacterium]|nr:FtsX-like permease family protein [Rickettsiales bacterium]
MNKIAIKMLMGDKAKYLGLIFGIMFATLLMSQQMSLFVGIMARTFALVSETSEGDIWVMNNKVQYVDGIEPMPDVTLGQVRGVEGVKWAVPMHKGQVVVKVNGNLELVTLIGVDDVSLVGAPRKMLMGNLNDINRPNAVIVDKLGYDYIWGKDGEMSINKEFEANDQRMVLVGICNSTPNFASPILMYSRYNEAIKYTGQARNKMSFIIVKVKEGNDAKEVAKRINEETGFKALTWQEFSDATYNYYITHTGIAINFGITVLLGFIVGAVISGQTFYIFVVENLKQFAALKAIGVTHRKIMQMVLTQAAVVGSIGFAMGIGLTSIFFGKVAKEGVFKGFYLPLEVVIGTALAVILIMIISSFISIRKVFVVDPAIVFRG